MLRLGDRLVAEGLLDPGHLRWALGVQRRTGSRLGAILVAAGLIRRPDLYRVLAQAWGLEYVDLASEELDTSLLTGLDATELAATGWFPVRVQDDGRVMVAVTDQPTRALVRRILDRLGRPVDLRVTSDWDLVTAVHRGFRETVVDDATLGLWRRSPDRSARTVLNRPQRITAAVLAVVLLAALVLALRDTVAVLLALVALGFLLPVTFRFVVAMVGVHHENDETVTREDLDALAEHELPLYTVLVPVHGGTDMGALVAHLGALDYPAEKLEILLLLEEDDTATIAAARAARPPRTISFLLVPPGEPRTRSKACNVGLYLARGEHLVIYDAGDRPEPDQLRKAVVAFRRHDERLLCVQAAVNCANTGQNWLTRMATTEYSSWFDYLLPGLERLGLPIPLGGTSNHFRTAALHRLGGWDPFNATEDADLGIRAAALGWEVGAINSTTLEEAAPTAGAWVRHHSRGVQGYLQTLLVHLRHPVTLLRAAGLRQTLAFALLIGGTPLAYLATPVLSVLFLLSLLVAPRSLTPLVPGWAVGLGLLALLLGSGMTIYISMMGAFKRRRYALVHWSLLTPASWLLHAAASYRALWQLVTRPHSTRETVHGHGHAAPASEPGGGGDDGDRGADTADPRTSSMAR